MGGAGWRKCPVFVKYTLTRVDSAMLLLSTCAMGSRRRVCEWVCERGGRVVLLQDPRDLFDLIEVVGTGTYGEVHKVCNGPFSSVVVRLAYAFLLTVTTRHL
jgi:hypothetical protein